MVLELSVFASFKGNVRGIEKLHEFKLTTVKP